MIKVAILGPESTGKSSLAQSLSAHFGAPWVPEYAREYVEKLTVPYTYKDVCNIAYKQLEQEKIYATDPFNTEDGFVFFDTDLIITAVWFQYCFDTIPDFVQERLNVGYFDVYLLCFPDLPWEPDSVREHGHDREFFFDWYKREIDKTRKPCYIIDGQGEMRLQNATKALSQFLQG